MSNNSAKMIYNKYFSYMLDTAKYVTPIIKEVLSKNLDLEAILTPPFHGRIEKPKLRSLALRLSYEISGGRDWKDIAPVCAAIELLDTSHYASDDILDLESQDKKKTSELLIASHILYSLSQDLLLSMRGKFSDKQILSTMNESNQIHLTIQKGFYNENFLINTFNIEQNIKRLHNYAFWNSLMAIGGILSGANNSEIQALRLFGDNVGIGYTLANDACDIGKTCEDLRAAKITIPILHAIKNSNNQDKNKIKKCLGKWNCSEELLLEAKLAIIRSGAVSYTKDLAMKYVNKGIEYLSIFPDSYPKTLLEYTTRIVHHNKLYQKIEEIGKNICVNDTNGELKKELQKLYGLT